MKDFILSLRFLTWWLVGSMLFIHINFNVAAFIGILIAVVMTIPLNRYN